MMLLRVSGFLKEIIVAVDSKLEVLIDSGIRSGQDLLKAKALNKCNKQLA